MFSLKALLAVLDAWPKWKRIQETPNQLAALDKRVASLESRLARAPGEACPKCGELEFRVSSSRPEPGIFGDIMGVIQREMLYGKCGYSEKKPV